MEGDIQSVDLNEESTGGVVGYVQSEDDWWICRIIYR
jgi:predicted alpha/beta-fold hydrolase